MALVAITTLLGTVNPVVVFAENTTVVSNSVHSASQTGGVNGVSGQAGQDGQDGQDGQAGRDGDDGNSGNASAGASVTNVLPGKTAYPVSAVRTTESGDAEVVVTNQVTQSDSGITATTATGTVLQTIHLTTTASLSDENQLLSLLTSLRAALTAYVQSLF
jgi:hypothetical protein